MPARVVCVVSSFSYCPRAVDIDAMPGARVRGLRARRLRNTLLFGTGKAVIARSASAAAANRTAHEVVAALRAAGVQDAQVGGFEVVRTVLHADCGHAVDLRALAAAYPTQATPFRRDVSFAAHHTLHVRVSANGHCVVNAEDAAAAQEQWRAFAADVLSRFTT